MGTISIVKDGGRATILASGVYPVGDFSPTFAGEFTFEALERDGRALERCLGERHLLSLDGGQVFWGELISLAPCTSTVQALALMRERPALRGVFRVYPDATGIKN